MDSIERAQRGLTSRNHVKDFMDVGYHSGMAAYSAISGVSNAAGAIATGATPLGAFYGASALANGASAINHGNKAYAAGSKLIADGVNNLASGKMGE